MNMNPAQNLGYMEHQVRLAMAGEIAAIECPYCGIGVRLGAESLCCELAGEAVAAILHRMETQDQLDQVARIADGAEALAHRSVLVH